MEEELFDWELIHRSDIESTDLGKKSGNSSVIDDGMMILSDHFSLDNTDPIQYGILDPVRVDYGLVPPNQRRDPDSEIRVSDFEGVSEKHIGSEAVTELTGVNVAPSEDASKILCVSDDLEVANRSYAKSWSDSEGTELGSGVSVIGEERIVSGCGNGNVADLTRGTVSHCEHGRKCLSESDDLEFADGSYVEDSRKLRSDSRVNVLVSGDSGFVNAEEEIVSDNEVSSAEATEGSGENTVEVVSLNSAVRSGDENESREIVWWKMPLVLLKYYAFKIGPVWSVSMAAAVMGLVILGRRLYNMKKKAQRFNLKVAIDDKKASRVMSQAARLNERFTEVRRFPVIRPALPSPGTWPVLSLR